MAASGGALASPAIRLLCFALCFILLALLEAILAARPQAGAGDRRLITNFGLGIGNALLGAGVPIGALSAAAFAEAHGIGLFQLVAAPFWAMLLAFLLVRSLFLYGLHRASHHVRWLWRIHRVHHSDRFVDLSTAFRNHPAELVLAMAFAALVTGALGVSVPVAAAGELILLAPSLWTHANMRLPALAGRLANWLVMTPAAHLRHHSSLRTECDSNYGELLSLWDRLFGTYFAPAPVARLGLGDAEDEGADDLLRQAVRPFRP